MAAGELRERDKRLYYKNRRDHRAVCFRAHRQRQAHQGGYRGKRSEVRRSFHVPDLLLNCIRKKRAMQ